MQSGSCSFSHLEVSGKIMETFIFKNAKKKIKLENQVLVTVSTKDILASRTARNLLNKFDRHTIDAPSLILAGCLCAMFR